MKIGIIGTGAIGSTIAKKLAAKGHQVTVTNTDEPPELAKTAKELGATSATIYDVVKDVEVIIVSVPTSAIPELPEDLFKEVPDDVIIVDTSNYYPFRDGKIKGLEDGKVESMWVSEHFGRPVVKAFNNLLAHTLANAGKVAGEKGRIAMAISGDDQNAKKIVSKLINYTGFDAVDAGELSASWRHQPGTPAYCTELEKLKLKEALYNANKDKARELRDRVIGKFQEFKSVPSHEEVIELNRLVYSQKA